MRGFDAPLVRAHKGRAFVFNVVRFGVLIDAHTCGNSRLGQPQSVAQRVQVSSVLIQYSALVNRGRAQGETCLFIQCFQWVIVFPAHVIRVSVQLICF